MSVSAEAGSSTPFRLRQLRFGNIDARYEVLTRDPQTLQHFRESFLAPSGITIDEFIKGTRFFIYGMKGAGKTAFLRYLRLKAEEDHCLTVFTSFATEISDGLRESIYTDAGIRIYEQKGVEEERSAVNIWIIFIFKQIADLIAKNPRTFVSRSEIRVFCEMVGRFHDGETKGILTWLSSALKRGKYKLKTRYFSAKVSGKEADMERDYTVDAIVDQGFSLLRHLSWEGVKHIYLFFDELNLSFGSRTQHKRDAVLIRDLILAVDRMNGFFIEHEKPIFLIAAARSEVLHALNVPTHEINKVLTDRGRELRWHGHSAAADWPIIRLLEKKINASEKLAGRMHSRDVFSDYFFRDIFGMSPQSLVVELTWCNPRDLILLFGNAAAAGGNESRFGEAVLYRVLEKFSSDAWNEKTEELNVEYAATEIQSIKKVLVNFRRYFKLDHFEAERKLRGGIDQNIKQFATKRSAAKVLEDLYRIGVLGQSSRPPAQTGLTQLAEHWAYRGDHSFDPSAWMIVHRGLWPELRLGRIQTQVETVDVDASQQSRKTVVIKRTRRVGQVDTSRKE